MKMSFGQNLQFYRKKYEITQEQLAEELGVSRQTISKWEGDVSHPEMEKIIQLCDRFECSMDLLLRGNAKENAEEDTYGYDKHMNQFCYSMITGLGIIIPGAAMQIFLEAIGVRAEFADAVILFMAIPAILIFVVAGLNHARYCEKHFYIQPFYPEETIERFEQRFPVLIAAGVGIIMMGVVLLIVLEGLTPPFGWTEDFYTAIFMLIATVGICILVYAGMQKGKYNIEDYNKGNEPKTEESVKDKRIGMWCGCIMLVATAIFLIAGLGYEAWEKCWIVFPVGGLLCGIATIIISGTTK